MRRIESVFPAYPFPNGSKVRKLFEAGQAVDDPGHAAAALSRIQIARARHDTRLEGKNLTQVLRSRGKEVTLRHGSELLLDLVSLGTGGINHTLDDRPGGDDPAEFPTDGRIATTAASQGLAD